MYICTRYVSVMSGDSPPGYLLGNITRASVSLIVSYKYRLGIQLIVACQLIMTAIRSDSVTPTEHH